MDIAYLDKLLASAEPQLKAASKLFLSIQDPRWDAEIGLRLSPKHVTRLSWPKGSKGASDVLDVCKEAGSAKAGIDIIRKTISLSQPIPVAGIYEPDDYRDKVIDVYHNGNPPGFSLGLSGLKTRFGKDIYTIKEGTMTVTTGNYGSGKSEFVENLEIIMAVEHDWRFLVFTAEAPPEQAIANLAEKYIGQPFSQGYRERMELPKLSEALDWVQEHFTFFDTSETNFSIDKIIEYAEIFVKRKSINGLVLDPWNNIEYSNRTGMRDDLYLGQCLRKLNILKRQRNLWINIVAHPLSMRRDKEGKFPVPTLRDISGGITWGNMTDFGLVVDYDRNEENSLVHIYCQKVKFRHLGKIGVGYLNFDLATARYYDAKDLNGDIIHAEPVAAKAKKNMFTRPD